MSWNLTFDLEEERLGFGDQEERLRLDVPLEKSWWSLRGYLEAPQRKQWKQGGEDLWIRQGNPMVSVGKWL